MTSFRFFYRIAHGLFVFGFVILAIVFFHQDVLGGEGSSTKIVFYAMGDIPYDDAQVKKLIKGMERINHDSSAQFVVHLGDIFKSGLCSEENYKRVSTILATANMPVFIVLGDNEFNDCQSPAAGRKLWDKYFLNKYIKSVPEDGLGSGWKGFPKATRQPGRPENFSLIHNGILFIGINLVGVGEKDDIYGGRDDYEDHWILRLTENYEWIKYNFKKYDATVTHAVIFGHAMEVPGHSQLSNFFEIVGSYSRDESGPIFKHPVLFLHGDGHKFRIRQNKWSKRITRVQVAGGKNANWLLKVIVTDNKDIPFKFYH